MRSPTSQADQRGTAGESELFGIGQGIDDRGHSLLG